MRHRTILTPDHGVFAPRWLFPGMGSYMNPDSFHEHHRRDLVALGSAFAIRLPRPNRTFFEIFLQQHQV